MVCWSAVGEDREILFLQAGNNLSALLVINDCVHIDDLGGDRDLLSLLRFAGQVRRQRLFRFLALLSWFSRPFVLLLISGWRLAARLSQREAEAQAGE